MKAKLSDLVRTASGEVVKLSDLIDRGEVTFSKSDKFYKRGGGTRVAFFADHKDGGCWEVSRAAYEYRTTGSTHLDHPGDIRGSDGSLIGRKEISDSDFLAPILAPRRP